MSTVSDLTNKIMIPESGIMDGRHQNRSVYRLPRRVFSLRLCSTHFPHLFSFSLFSTWEPVLKLINSLFLLTFLFTYYVTNLNCERSSVNFFKTSSICFASSLVGVIIIAPIWWSWREKDLTQKNPQSSKLYTAYMTTFCPQQGHLVTLIIIIQSVVGCSQQSVACPFSAIFF